MDLPLHEDDLDAEGVIRASAITPLRPDMPAAAVLCWFPEVVEDVGTRSETVTVLRSELGRSPVWRTTGPGGTPVAVLHPGVGAPLAAMFLEHLAALGVRTVVGVGGAGALRHELTLGHAVVLGSALRDEGTSFHYQPPSRTIDADPDGVDAVVRVLDGAGVPHVVGRCWTTDAVFRETPARVARRRERIGARLGLRGSALRAELIEEFTFVHGALSTAANAAAAMPWVLPWAGPWGTLAVSVASTVIIDVTLQLELAYAVAAIQGSSLRGEPLRRACLQVVRLSSPQERREAARTVGLRVGTKKLAERALVHGAARGLGLLDGTALGTPVSPRIEAAVAWAGVPVVSALAWKDMRAVALRATTRFQTPDGTGEDLPGGR